MNDDHENMAALAALQAQVPNSFAVMPGAPMRISLCPHCRQGFGAASIAIHVRRCRALLPDPQINDASTDACSEMRISKPLKKRSIPTLVDLCLKLFTRHFQVLCIDKVKTAPEHEAALIASLPPDLVHRLIITLVYENKKSCESIDTHRTNMRNLQRELDAIKKHRGQLEGFRHQATTFRQTALEHEQTIGTLRRELGTTTQELTNARHHNTTLRSQFKQVEKTQLRLEARINTLVAENEKLKQEVQEAQQKEKNTYKRLASVVSAIPRTNTRGIRHDTNVEDYELSNMLSLNATLNTSGSAPPSKRIRQTSNGVKQRPRVASNSKIPYPSHP